MTKPTWQDYAPHDESIAPELWGGVIGAWAPCLGPTGSRLHDHSRRGNWGTLTNMNNATDWVLSDGQYALDFDGTTNKSVNAGTLQGDSLGYPFSMSCWVRNMTFSDPDGSPFAKFVNPMIYVSGGKAIAFWGGTRATSAATVSGRAEWIQLAICWTGAQAQVVVNGVIDGTGSTTVAPSGAANALTIGQYDPTRKMAGQVDDCMIWRRCLSPNEWRQLYQLGRGGMYQRRRRSRIYLPQGGFQAAWARGSNVLLGFNQP